MSKYMSQIHDNLRRKQKQNLTSARIKHTHTQIYIYQ